MEDEKPRAVKNGMSQAEYDTWMFLSDKEAGAEEYTYVVKQSDLTSFLDSHIVAARIEEVEQIPIAKLDSPNEHKSQKYRDAGKFISTVYVPKRLDTLRQQYKTREKSE